MMERRLATAAFSHSSTRMLLRTAVSLVQPCTPSDHPQHPGPSDRSHASSHRSRPSLRQATSSYTYTVVPNTAVLSPHAAVIAKRCREQSITRTHRIRLYQRAVETRDGASQYDSLRVSTRHVTAVILGFEFRLANIDRTCGYGQRGGIDPNPETTSSHTCSPFVSDVSAAKSKISCIVDDADKRKARKPPSRSNGPRPSTSQKRMPSAANRPPVRKSSTGTSLSSNVGDANSINSIGSSSAAASGVPLPDDNDLKFAGGRVFGDQIVYPSEARLAPRTPDSSSDEDEDSSPPSTSRPTDFSGRRTASAGPGPEPHVKTQDRNPKDSANIDTWERFSTRSRPLTLLTELVPRQNGFASKVFRLVSARATIETDVSEIVSDEKSKQLSDWCEHNLTLWMPHVSNAYQLRQDAKQGKQTLSTQLLEQVLYVIAMQHIRDPRDDVSRFSVTRFIIRDLARVMLTSPRSSNAVEALELLALFPVDVSAIPGPSRNRIRTDAQISAAERFARSVRLDRVALTAAAPYSFFASTNQLDDFQTKRTAMAWASVKTWYNCFTLGDDELYETIDDRFFSDDWSRSLILPPQETSAAQIEQPASTPSLENEFFAQRRWSSRRRIGSTGLAMRSLAMRQLLDAFNAIRTSSIQRPEHERLSHMSMVLEDYERRITQVDDEFQRRLIDGKDGCKLLRTWITIETTAGHLLVLSTGIYRGLGIEKKENVPGPELAMMMIGENASLEMREFLTHYGEHLILAAEKVLVNISTLCRDAREAKSAPSTGEAADTMDPTSRRWMVDGQSRTVLPMINACGYALEAAFSAMEMHATMFKLWKTPPKRSESWQQVFSDVITAMLSLDPSGSIQSGSIPATCAYILQGMLKVIVAWTDSSRQKDHQRNTASTPGTETAGAPTRHVQECANGHSSHQPAARPRANVASELERYSALLTDDGASRRSFDAVQAFASDASASPSRQQDVFRPHSTGSNASTYSTTASMFEAEAQTTYQYSHLRGGPAVQRFAPDATESLAAALPHSGSYPGATGYAHTSQQPLQARPQQRNHFAPSTLGAPGSSGASPHTETASAYYQNVGNGVAMMNSSSNGSVLSHVDASNGANSMGGGGDVQASEAGLDSLDFILNDVLGSSEWSGILQDIWRTDI
ncbi:hypothetical protein PHSY_004181 [Pseudozyma hubeiensis SY62]|uniref:Uncharacterized protein n=1 Tax=Pseudozyma hubeiensis (strain SY62) TaxID=1305764 RepID=R9P5J6_PSEHS|nr:hypothetical protein PHSY_004181 [Pseudozyma hubeiensis SY62]GAC96599.1 hypothetical protein PHSY_004181 [Pseudozyma hubeiensis SY62]